MDNRLNSAFWALRIGLGAGAFLAGLDKFFNILADWETYLSPLATRMLPLSAGALMRVVGVIEMIAGLALLAGLTRIAAYVVMAWLIAIAIGAYTLARLAEIRERGAVALRTATAH